MASSSKSSVRGHRNGRNSRGNSNCGRTENGTENSAVELTPWGLRFNPGISLSWTPEEQSTLEVLLSQYTAERKSVRFARIAQVLNDKTARDVGFFCRWMSKIEIGKRRKDDNTSSRKYKDKKEKATDSLPKSSQVENRLNDPLYTQPMVSMDTDDGISSKAIGGPVGQLLEHNAQALGQISANFSAFKIRENINLFRQARANIISISNELRDTPDPMKQMPPLPVSLNEVSLNEGLANYILPCQRTS